MWQPTCIRKTSLRILGKASPRGIKVYAAKSHACGQYGPSQSLLRLQGCVKFDVDSLLVPFDGKMLHA